MCFPLSERATLDAEEWDQHITGPIHSATLLHTTSRCRTPVSKDGKYNYPVNRALRFALELEKVTLFSYYDSTLSSDSPQISKLWRVRVFTQSSSRLPVLSSLNSSKQPSAFEASPTKNNLREALYYQVFDRFEPPVNPPCSASRSTAVFHSSWCRPSRGGIVSAIYFVTRFGLFATICQKPGVRNARQWRNVKAEDDGPADSSGAQPDANFDFASASAFCNEQGEQNERLSPVFDSHAALRRKNDARTPLVAFSSPNADP